MHDDDPFDYAPPAQVLSPCIDVCALDLTTGWCLGCGRSGDEIEEWPNASDARRQAILDDLPKRMATLARR